MKTRSSPATTLRLIPVFIIAWVAGAVVTQGHEPSGKCVVWDQLPGTHHVSRHCGTLTPRRIVLVTSENRQDRLKEQDLFVQSLATHLRKSGKFDVVVSVVPMCRDHLPMQSGTFDELHLLRLSRKHRADCVLYCDLEQLSAYRPMHAELSMLLVHVSEAVALVSAKSSYDLRERATLAAYRRFLGSDDPQSALNIDHHTPSRFIDFAACHFATGILSVW